MDKTSGKQLAHSPYVMIEPYAKLSGYTLDELAERLDVSIRTLKNKINGTSDFSISQMKTLCKLLDKTIDALFLC